MKSERSGSVKRVITRKYYALINPARGPYEEIFVLTFKALEGKVCENKSKKVTDVHASI